MFLSKLAFFISGVTRAFLNSDGTFPAEREQFTRRVIKGSRMSRQEVLRSFVGSGSRGQLAYHNVALCVVH